MGALCALKPFPARDTLCSALRRGAAGVAYFAGSYRKRLRGKVAVLMYHRVLSSEDRKGRLVQPGMYVDAQVFEEQIRFLAGRLRALSPDEFLEGKGTDGAEGSCLVTFDDGWRDNYVNAFPVLRKYGVPALVFLPVDWIGSSRWFRHDLLAWLLSLPPGENRNGGSPERRFLERYPWIPFDEPIGDPERFDRIVREAALLGAEEYDRVIGALAEWKRANLPEERIFLDWNEVRTMSRHGIRFGAHGRTHEMLSGMEPDRLKDEVEGPMRVLEEEGARHVPVFCYPNGDHDEATLQAVRKAGYRSAMTTRFGLETLRPQDPFRIRRIGIHDDMSRTRPLFAWRISGVSTFR